MVDSWVGKLRDRLKDAGLRATAPRLAVLRYLEGAEQPLTHAEVAEELGREGLDRATVYRNLVDLVEAGVAHRSDMGDHVWRFQLVRSQHHEEEHPHFICSACGAVQCLPKGAVAVRSARGAPRALRQASLSIQLRGVCDKCT